MASQGYTLVSSLRSRSMKRKQAVTGARLWWGAGLTRVRVCIAYCSYESVFTRIRDRIKRLFGITKLWFTAPTFTTRLVGNPEWSAAEMHDEYWTIHVDKNNTVRGHGHDSEAHLHLSNMYVMSMHTLLTHTHTCSLAGTLRLQWLVVLVNLR